MNTVQCLICQKNFKYVSNTHLKSHSLTISEYKIIFPDAKIRIDELTKSLGSSTRGKTYEQLYGSEKATALKQIRRDSAKHQMQDQYQRYVRKLKCGREEFYTETRKKNMSISNSKPETKERRRNTVLKNLESGKYKKHIFGRSSTQALLYIKDYISTNNIDDDKCYYSGGGINGNEYYQVVYDINNKRRSISYDLVITNDGKHNIDIIIEINGPWHYRDHEVYQTPDLPACPLKSNKYTIKESYNIDVMKINHALDISKYVYVYWLDNKELVQITNKLNFIK